MEDNLDSSSVDSSSNRCDLTKSKKKKKDRAVENLKKVTYNQIYLL
jgi:hypothetical protein